MLAISHQDSLESVRCDHGRICVRINSNPGHHQYPGRVKQWNSGVCLVALHVIVGSIEDFPFVVCRNGVLSVDVVIYRGCPVARDSKGIVVNVGPVWCYYVRVLESVNPVFVSCTRETHRPADDIRSQKSQQAIPTHINLSMFPCEERQHYSTNINSPAVISVDVEIG